QSAVTVNLSYSGTAANGSDFSGVVSVNIPAGASSASFSLATIDDALVETAESFSVSIASATGGNFETLLVSGPNGSVSTAITDNDTTTLSVSSPTVSEDAGYAQFTVSLSNASSQTTTVSLILANGSASSADFGPALEVSTDGGATWVAATEATLPAYQTSVLVRTPITSDTLDEVNETFSLTATQIAGTPVTNPGGAATGMATIADDDATPSLTINSVTVNEGAGSATFTVTLSAASGQTVTVNYGTSNSTALSGAGNDYTAASGTLTFAPGTTSQTITVPVLNDGVYEGSEAFNVTLSSATNATLATASGVGTILDNGTGAGGTDNDMPTLAVSSVSVAESGGYAQFTVSLSNPSTSPVVFTPSLNSGMATLGTDTAAAGTLQVSTDNGATWSSVSGNVSIAAGSTSVLLRLAVTNDTTVEGSENFTLTTTVVGGGTANGSASGTATITDNDAIVVSGTTSDDDDVNENRDAIAGNNIVHTGVISNVAPTVTLAISDSGTSGLTSNGEAITYSWSSASRTLTASSVSGSVFTVVLSAANDGYTFTQLRGIDHAVLAGESQSLNIPLTLTALDANGATFTSSVFNVTVYDDAPSVTGSRIIATENDGSFADSGYLTGATVSNDITGVSWNTSALPALVFEGKPVLYVDHGNGTLTGELSDGTLIFRATINPNVVDANNHPQYSFELLNALGRLGIEGAASSYTVISGGNISNLDLGFGGYLVDSMTAVTGTGATTTVNTNNNWIGLGGNWFDPGEKLLMSFTDPTGNPGQVRGMDLVVEGQGSAAYTLNWTVTAAIDYAGNTITYSGSVSGVGNTDVPFSIPLSGDALYFTNLQISDPAGSGQFRIALSSISSNDYVSDIPLALDYTLTDADGDTAAGMIDVTLMAGGDGGIVTGTSGADTLSGTSSADTLTGGAGNDTLSGLLGGDTFTWHLADRGTSASPARDTVTDFDRVTNSDKLDLRDLLQGESHTGTNVGNLANYLHFSYDSATSTTVVEVKSQGSAMTGPDQIINLSSVDLVAGFTSDQQIIQDLLSKGKLITD
ncbi:MAG: Calx-beta domain-containing protein, partial [Thiobacillus sp.]|nr:Calx-beta domain-containing protein [Thiobacillus sp.]